MSQPLKQETLDLYEKVLLEIKARIELAFLKLNGTPSLEDLEHAALNLRMTIELVVMGSLVNNRAATEAVATAFAAKKPEGVRKTLKQANPRYWPEPKVIVPTGPDSARVKPLTESYLREKDAWRIRGYLGGLLHAPNPFTVTPSVRRPDLDETVTELRKIALDIQALLAHHWTYLADDEYAVEAFMSFGPTGNPLVLQRIRLFTNIDPATGLPRSA